MVHIYIYGAYIYYGRIIDKNCVVLLAHVWLQKGKTKIWVLSLWSYINCGVHKKLRFEQQYSQYVDIGKTIFLGAWKWSFTLQRKQPSNNGENWLTSGDNGSFQFLGEPWIQFAKCWFMCVSIIDSDNGLFCGCPWPKLTEPSQRNAKKDWPLFKTLPSAI